MDRLGALLGARPRQRVGEYGRNYLRPQTWRDFLILLLLLHSRTYLPHSKATCALFRAFVAFSVPFWRHFSALQD